jgi:hypothetical protein
LTGYSAVGIATTTNTYLQPELKPDHRWIEKVLFDLEIESLSQCLQDGRHTIGLHILNNLENLFQFIGDAWMIDTGAETLKRIYHEVYIFTAQQTDEIFAKDINTSLFGAIDSVSLLPINSLIALFRNLDTIDLQHIETELSHLKWGRADSIYKLNLPVVVLERLEFIQDRLDFERSAEGCVVSPTWYYVQLIFQSLGFALISQLKTLTNIGNDFYIDESKKLLKAGSISQAVIVISRGLEFYRKAFAHFAKAEAFTKKLDMAHKTEKLDWPIWDWPAVYQGIGLARDSLIEHLEPIRKLCSARFENRPYGQMRASFRIFYTSE